MKNIHLLYVFLKLSIKTIKKNLRTNLVLILLITLGIALFTGGRVLSFSLEDSVVENINNTYGNTSIIITSNNKLAYFNETQINSIINNHTLMVDVNHIDWQIEIPVSVLNIAEKRNDNTLLLVGIPINFSMGKFAFIGNSNLNVNIESNTSFTWAYASQKAIDSLDLKDNISGLCQVFYQNINGTLISSKLEYIGFINAYWRAITTQDYMVTSLQNLQLLITQNRNVNVITKILIEPKQNVNTTTLITNLKNNLGANFTIVDEKAIQTRLTLNNISQYISLNTVIVSIITLTSVILIINVNIISINTRRKQIGTLKSIGYPNKKIFWIYFFEALSIGFMASIIGAISGQFMAYVQKTLLVNVANLIEFNQAILTIETDVLLQSVALGLVLTLIGYLLPLFYILKSPILTMINEGSVFENEDQDEKKHPRFIAIPKKVYMFSLMVILSILIDLSAFLGFGIFFLLFSFRSLYQEYRPVTRRLNNIFSLCCILYAFMCVTIISPLLNSQIPTIWALIFFIVIIFWFIYINFESIFVFLIKKPFHFIKEIHYLLVLTPKFITAKESKLRSYLTFIIFFIIFLFNISAIVFFSNLGNAYGVEVQNQLGGLDIIGSTRLPINQSFLNNIKDDFPDISNIVPVYISSARYHGNAFEIYATGKEFRDIAKFQLLQQIPGDPWNYLNTENGTAILTDSFASRNGLTLNDSMNVTLNGNSLILQISAIMGSTYLGDAIYINLFDYGRLIPSIYSSYDNINSFVAKVNKTDVDLTLLAKNMDSKYWYIGLQAYNVKDVSFAISSFVGDFLNYLQLIILLGIIIGYLSLLTVIYRNIKEREITWQILKSIGYSKNKIKYLIMTETFTISFLALILSIPLTIGGAYLFWITNTSFKTIPFIIPVFTIISYILVLLVFTLIIAEIVYYLLTVTVLNKEDIIIDTQR